MDKEVKGKICQPLNLNIFIGKVFEGVGMEKVAQRLREHIVFPQHPRQVTSKHLELQL